MKNFFAGSFSLQNSLRREFIVSGYQARRAKSWTLPNGEANLFGGEFSVSAYRPLASPDRWSMRAAIV
jgi:hypothetical protein